MDTLIMLSIMTLVLVSGSGTSRGATLIVSNQMQTRDNVSVFVTCDSLLNPKLSKSVPLGQVSLTEIPTTAGHNATDDKSTHVALQQTSCVGTFYNGMIYPLYDSDKDSTVYKNVCVVVAKDNRFYRWNNDKNTWDVIQPIIIFN
ncbi:hypothetical protein EUTSA_v10015539mg [Eutrema salsugineum]|uniref:Uncharacterized protein n=1 Tax=Eutrema salsugineum TaxID=72664 RepID=V4LQX4_EUTSA|nr:uncharacterized protein LOC18016571 [Eutrema salsugineum]ESQ42258.1 hypothetical protein EUTSA_v10015539mg [Eutrema salsugineum]